MHRGFLKIAAILAMISVLLGASGAHTLKKFLSKEVLEIFDTAVRYQFYHTIGIFLAAILYKDFVGKWMKIAGYSFLLGILLFSGSLYLLTYAKDTMNENLYWIGRITPLGGTCFLWGWISILVGVRESERRSQRNF
jgi:uncharacterized membrane protein YgdD (TMEM256/DUF423 family)